MFGRNSLLSTAQVQRNPNEAVWLGSKVTDRTMHYAQVHDALPDFERRALSFSQPAGTSTSIHPRLDSILRKPTMQDPYARPVGVVSSAYGLVTHKKLFGMVDEALRSISSEPVKRADLLMSEFGERMHLSLYFPDQFTFDPGDGKPISLRLEVINSVDGSSRLRILLGWFRFVCSNGLVVGVTQMDMRQRHVRSIEPNEIMRTLPRRLKEAEDEIMTLTDWQKKELNNEALGEWVDGPLKEAWGFKAAARTWLICNQGVDGEPGDSYAKYDPSTMPMKDTRPVPGAPEQAGTIFDVAQALAWIAKERNEIEERIAWRAGIPGLLAKLKQ